MSIEWTDDLATGVERIDVQHKELFLRINNLLDACKTGKGREEVKKTIQFLDDYVVTHFTAEETYMQKYTYPEYNSHKLEHQKFAVNFTELKKQFEKDGPGVHMVVATNQIVVDWLQNHIRKVDKALGSFLKTRLDQK